MLTRTKSAQVFAEACEVMPGGVNSPVRAFTGLGVAPLVVQKGRGDTIWDVDGNAYIDYCMSWGALILGHADPRVVTAASAQVGEGSSFGITTAIEAKMAQEVVSLVPSIEKVRFVSSGTEATMSAIRLARAFSGKTLIVKFSGNYHGHSDQLLIGAGSGVSHLPAGSPGVPDEMVRSTLSLRYNDLEGTRALLRENPAIGAVILEPIAANMGLVSGTSTFLKMLREECTKRKIVLIFDEVVSGFRMGLSGAQGHFAVAPDLTCLGKIIGGGFPAAAFGGKKEIMELLAPQGKVYQAGTLSGNPVAMRAGLTTLQAIQEPHFYKRVEEKMRRLVEPVALAIQKKGLKAHIAHSGSMFSLFFGIDKPSCQEDLDKLDKALFKRFFAYLLERGIYLSPSPYETCFISSAHTEEHLDRTAKVMCEFIDGSSE